MQHWKIQTTYCETSGCKTLIYKLVLSHLLYCSIINTICIIFQSPEIGACLLVIRSSFHLKNGFSVVLFTLKHYNVYSQIHIVSLIPKTRNFIQAVNTLADSSQIIFNSSCTILLSFIYNNFQLLKSLSPTLKYAYSKIYVNKIQKHKSM